MRLQEPQDKHVLRVEIRLFPAPVQIYLTEKLPLVNDPDAGDAKIILAGEKAAPWLGLNSYLPPAVVQRPVDEGLAPRTGGLLFLQIVLPLRERTFLIILLHAPTHVGLEKAAVPADAAEKQSTIIGHQLMEPQNGKFQKFMKGKALVGPGDQAVELQNLSVVQWNTLRL
jgi:hypothetical protein